MATLLAMPRHGLAGPTGGTVVQGSAGISQAGAVTTINQSSNRAIINWQSFSIGKSETVNFNQPSAGSATLNRVTGSDASVIAGALNATGQVFLVNPNGVLFAKGSQVNVGGLVASTLDITNADFMAGRYVFQGTSSAAIVNQGRLHARNGGYISLLGHTVVNDGVISATMGTVAMASGEKITLNFGGDSLLDVTVDKGVLNAMVANKRMIKADGGTVVMTARAADQILSAQVNNSGVVQARSMAALKGGASTAVARTGKIKLLAQGGAVNVSGKLDASAPKGGQGGAIETSGDQVKIADGAVITTKAANGNNGTWLIDPTDFAIVSGSAAQTQSGIGAKTLLNELANGNVTIVTSASGTEPGDINVNAALDWSSASATPSTNSLTLAAYNNININAPMTWSAGTLTLNAGANVYVNSVMTATGTASFAANYGYQINANGSVSTAPTGTGNADHTPYGLYTLQGTSALGTYTGQINFSGTGTVTLNGTRYTVIESASDLWGAATGVPSTDPWGKPITVYHYQSATPIALNGNYVLGADFSATTLDPGTGRTVGVSPTAASAIGTDATPFTGNFNGFGHTITLGANTNGNTGLFGTIGTSGVVGNLNLNGRVQAGLSTSASGGALGPIADVNYGTIVNTVATNASFTYGSVYAYDTVAATGSPIDVGGFVGNNEAGGSIYTSFVRLGNYGSGAAGSAATVVYAGGFAGVNAGLISQSYTRAGASGVYSHYDSNANLVKVVSPGSIAGGFVGKNTSTGVIDQSYVNYGSLGGPESVNGAYIAGFVGDNSGKITNSYTLAPDYTSYGAITYTAGFAYINSGTISTSYAQLGSYNKNTYAFVAVSNGGTTTDDYYSYKSDPSAGTAPSDSSTAHWLTVAQAAQISNFTGFDSTIWGEEIGVTPPSGFQTPILRELPVLIEPVSGAAVPVYGSTASQILASSSSSGGTYLTAIGLQGYDSTNYSTATPLNQFSLTTPSTGYLDAGIYLAGSVVKSGVYSNIKGILTVSPATLTLASGVVNDKTYDGTTTATVNNGLANGGLVGLVANQTLTINYQSAVFGSKNAGQESATVVFAAADGANGGKASNYTISNNATATISPLTIGASFTASDKVYDGLANANGSAQLSGVLPGDTVSLNYASVLFGDANAGQSKPVTVSGLTLTNSNYALGATTITSTASIQPLAVDLYGNATAATSTAFPAAGLYVKNAVPGDTVNLTGMVTLAGTSNGIQPITSASGATLNNPNYTLTGAIGKVLIGTPSLALDQVVSGQVTIASSGSTTTVTEASNSAIIDWLRFSISGNETVSFIQPSSTSVILNRVTGNEQSVVAGALTANGRVFIVNSNGVLFTSASSVNVGALVATTQSIADTDFANGAYTFTQLAGPAGKVEADGAIDVAPNSFIALTSGNGVAVSGKLTAPGGKELLASANTLSLTLDTATPGATAYSFGGLSHVASIGGILDVSAGNQPGGVIESAGDTVALSNTLSMNIGAGGTWSFSQNADITVGARGTVSAQFLENSLAGGNFSLNSYRGAITINDAVTWWADTHLTLTAATNINVNNALTGNGRKAGLTLAYGGFAQAGTAAPGYDYYVNNLTIGSDGSVVIGAAMVKLPYATESLTINGHAYALIEDMSQLENLQPSYVLDQYGSPILDLNSFSFVTAVTGYYALGQDIKATQTYAGAVIPNFAGTLAGLGHTISNLTISDKAGNGGNGLIGTIGATALIDWSDTKPTPVASAVVRDLSLTSINISGPGISFTGGLAASALAASTISNVYVQGSISGGTNQSSWMSRVGGLAGYNDGLIANSHVDITITAPGAVNDLGGLVGWNAAHAVIDHSSATGHITVEGYALPTGGFVGSRSVGGLVGWNIGIIENSFANMAIVANTTTDIGGLVGLNYQISNTPGEGTAALINDWSAGSITAENKSTLLIQDGNIGGLVGNNQGGTISNVSSTTSIEVTADYYLGPGKSGGFTNNEGNASFSNVGGLIGNNDSSFWTGNGGSLANGTYNANISVNGNVSSVGSAVGRNGLGSNVTGVTTTGLITASAGRTSGTGQPNGIDGLVGDNFGSLSHSSTSTTVMRGNSVGGDKTAEQMAAEQAAAKAAAEAVAAVQAAAGRTASQLANAVEAGATTQALSAPNAGNFGASDFNLAAPPKTDDSITFQQPSPGSAPASGMSATDGPIRRRTALRGGNGGRRANGANLGASIRSIEVDGQRFDLQAPAPGDTPAQDGGAPAASDNR